MEGQGKAGIKEWTRRAKEDGTLKNRNRRGPNKLPADLKDRILFILGELEEKGRGLRWYATNKPEAFLVNFVKPMLPKNVILDAKVEMTYEQAVARLRDFAITHSVSLGLSTQQD